ncbi:DinB family protein [Mycolicibacterium wolinskyi]|uniref:Mini-circle protein n=1 Tax=Mycolicibacterium wolinskyi TaxID=59750 RepID=A0A1X2FIN2_9MYCO|nr:MULTISPECIES: DinB family protein [Mycolicibacterium]MCV7288035.1 DinB family protein [Mycolicibacterium wolinskyi]MCV7296760.1 DinB family protein [Mycolicibacterium goodii]ORX18296.1 Mini-circle protein [Mycolicibacterium wolinskyi]
MSTVERSTPPLAGDERATLESWLDFYRATLAAKCAGLSEQQLRTAAVPPSSLTLMGIVQHETEVERNWFRRVLIGEEVPSIYGPRSTEGHDGGFDPAIDIDFETAYARWQSEIEQSKANCAGRALDDTSPFMGSEVTLRWIYTHMIAEYARHCGHADLIRESIDGATGV